MKPNFWIAILVTAPGWIGELTSAEPERPKRFGDRVAAAVDSATDWRQALAAARTAWATNRDSALAWSDRAVVLAPKSAEPLLLRATFRDAQGDYPAALRDVTEAIQLDPAKPTGWQLRGVVNFKLSRFRESVADFDRFLSIKPSQRPFHWQRGISLYYAGDFEEGRKQFELHQTVNSDDVENAVWHFLCLARSKGIEQARAALLNPGPDLRVPMREILALFAGKGTADEVLAAASSQLQNSEPMFYAHLYLGLYYEALSDKTRAGEHIGKAAELAPNHYMGDVARVHKRWLQERAK